MDEQYIVCKFGEALTCGTDKFVSQNIMFVYIFFAFCFGIVVALYFYSMVIQESRKADERNAKLDEIQSYFEKALEQKKR